MHIKDNKHQKSNEYCITILRFMFRCMTIVTDKACTSWDYPWDRRVRYLEEKRTCLDMYDALLKRLHCMYCITI